MAPSTYLSLLITISMIFISYAKSPTSTPKIYESVCKEIVQKFPVQYEQTCLKVLKAYPEITLAKDYYTFTKLYCKIFAIDHATKTQVKVKELVNKYPSSLAVKACATTDYDTVVSELKAGSNENPEEISLAIIYAFDALNSCKQRLTNEKIVDTTFSALNSAMDFVIEIANISSLKSS